MHEGWPPGVDAMREDVASMLHDDVLQCVIAARWALDEVAGELSDGAAASLSHVTFLLDHSQAVVRQRIADLRSPSTVPGGTSDGGARRRA